MAKDPPKSQPVGNTDDSKRGRGIPKHQGVKGTNPVTLKQVKKLPRKK